MSLTNRTIVVFGGTGGIGQDLAKKLKTQGANVVIASRSSEKLARMEAEGFATMAFERIAQPDFEIIALRAAERFGALDGVVNCLGSMLLKPAHRTSAEELQKVFEVNFLSAFHALQAAVQVFQQQNNGGSVVLISSVAARLGLVNHEAIAAAKAAVQGLCLSAAASYAPKRIRVNCVAPGLTLTPMTSQLAEATLKISTQMHPLGRLGRAEDISNAIEFLLDPDSEWITGQVLGVDGGLSTVRSR